VAGRTHGILAAAVQRIVRMAAFSPIPDAGNGVVGVLDVRGEVMPVVDPRPLLALPTVPPHPDQQLVLIDHTTRFMLWLDGVEGIVQAPLAPMPGDIGPERTRALTREVVQLDGQVIPILSLDVLDPGSTLAESMVVAPEPVP
jgi:purine-binding chemotaxis protein CheW